MGMRTIRTTSRHIAVRAGAAYGLLFGLTFALLLWGYDDLRLAIAASDLAWAKLIVALPPTVAICCLAGFLGGSTDQAGVTVLIWAIALPLVGWVTGHIPYDGLNLAIRLIDARFVDATPYPYLHAYQMRTLLVGLLYVPLGTAVGFLETWAVEGAWDRVTTSGKLSRRSWLVLATTATVAALLPALVADHFIVKPSRSPRLYLARLITTTLTEGPLGVERRGLNTTVVERYGASFTESYTLHFVSFYTATETLYASYVDVTFAEPTDFPFLMRCIIIGKRVNFCDDYTRRFQGWMDDLIYAARTGEQPWREAKVQRLRVDASVLAWLMTHRDRLQAPYTVRYLAQRGGWLWLAAYFETGEELRCRFYDPAPVRVDRCELHSVDGG